MVAIARGLMARPTLLMIDEPFLGLAPRIVHEIVDAGHRVFLDLKFHDIPNTVARAVAEVAGTGASFVDVHVSGGAAMMRAAAEATGRGRKRP